MEKPRITFRRNKNLRDIIGQTTIVNNQIHRKTNHKIGSCQPCLSWKDNLCCKQVLRSKTIKSCSTNETFKIFHNTNCKSSFVIYVLECTKCNIQYVGKAETQFSLWLNNHRKDATNPSPNAILAAKHFHNGDHNFICNAKFTIIESINDKQKTHTEKQKILLKRESYKHYHHAD